MANEQNLKPFPKGKSGNEKGAPKGQPHLKTVIRKILEGTMTVEEGGKKVKKTTEEIMMAVGVQDALNRAHNPADRTRARDSILDRLYGKPEQPVTGDINPIVNITITSDEAEF